MAGKALRIAFLWHNHQPYYEKDGEFILPWLRLHAVKDYYDLPLLLNEFPQIKQTINLVPSVFLQIDKYLNENVRDSIQRLSLIQARNLTKEEKSKILQNFFLCNEQNLIRPYPRFSELYDKSGLSDAVEEFELNDWLDLQVWYNLAWLGEFTKLHPFAKRLIQKGRDFSEIEKLLLLELHYDTMRTIVPLYKNLQSLGQIELSTTPYFHPILPLLIDTQSAKEANPNSPEISPAFAFPEDAKYQVSKAIEGFSEKFEIYPQGFWCSEGSVSNATLEILNENGIKWTATDEGVLFASEEARTGLEKYFPRKYKSGESEITIFFRDHILSDKIGFQYSNWHPFDAASDFVEMLRNIRERIVKVYSEEALDFAVVPIILDGENCWEFYPNNGFDFLRLLYSQISQNDELETVLFKDIANDGSENYLPELKSIRAGSWINANFDIWAGHPDDVAAWELLSKVRYLFELKKSSLNQDIHDEIYTELMIAEGSDWFWWYGPEHQAPNKSDFDIIFRWRIKRIYELLGEKAPEEIFRPIGSAPKPDFKQPEINQSLTSAIEIEIDKAGYFEFSRNFSTMHQTEKPSVILYFVNDDEKIYFVIKNLQENSQDNKLEIEIGAERFVLDASSSDLPDLITIDLNNLQSQIINKKVHVTLKLINLVDKTEYIKKFEYKFL